MFRGPIVRIRDKRGRQDQFDSRAIADQGVAPLIGIDWPRLFINRGPEFSGRAVQRDEPEIVPEHGLYS